MNTVQQSCGIAVMCESHYLFTMSSSYCSCLVEVMMEVISHADYLGVLCTTDSTGADFRKNMFTEFT